MLREDKIKGVYDYVKPHSDNRLCRFNLRQIWPKENNFMYDEDDKRTLEELGLYPSCTLRMVRKPL